MLLSYPDLIARLEKEGKPPILLDILQEAGPLVVSFVPPSTFPFPPCRGSKTLRPDDSDNQSKSADLSQSPMRYPPLSHRGAKELPRWYIRPFGLFYPLTRICE